MMWLVPIALRLPYTFLTEGLVKRADDPSHRRAVRAEVTALRRKRQAAGTPVVNAVLQDVANKLAAVDSQKLKRALDAIQ